MAEEANGGTSPAALRSAARIRSSAFWTVTVSGWGVVVVIASRPRWRASAIVIRVSGGTFTGIVARRRACGLDRSRNFRTLRAPLKWARNPTYTDGFRAHVAGPAGWSAQSQAGRGVAPSVSVSDMPSAEAV